MNLKPRPSTPVLAGYVLLTACAVCTPLDLELGLRGGVVLSWLRGDVDAHRPDSLDAFALTPVPLPSPLAALTLTLRMNDLFAVRSEISGYKSGERYRGFAPATIHEPTGYRDSAWVQVSSEHYRGALTVQVIALLPTEGRFTPYLSAGPAFSGLIAARTRETRYRSRHAQLPWADTTYATAAPMYRGDLLLCPGAGVEIQSTYGSITLDVRAGLGLLPLSPRSHSPAVRATMIAVTAGFTLGQLTALTWER